MILLQMANVVVFPGVFVRTPFAFRLRAMDRIYMTVEVLLGTEHWSPRAPVTAEFVHRLKIQIGKQPVSHGNIGSGKKND